MKEYIQKSLLLPKYLMPLLITSVLLSLIAIVLNITALIQMNDQVIDEPSGEVAVSKEVKEVAIEIIDETPVIEDESIYDNNSGERPSFLFNWPPKENIKELAGCYENNIVTIDGQRFCAISMDESAAGHVFTEYLYSTLDTNIEHSYTFTTRFVSDCGVYEGAAVQQCEQEKADFDADKLFYEYYQSLSK